MSLFMYTIDLYSSKGSFCGTRVGICQAENIEKAEEWVQENILSAKGCLRELWEVTEDIDTSTVYIPR